MNKILLLVAIAVVIGIMLNSPGTLTGGLSAVNYERPLVLEKTREGNGIKKVEFMPMFESNKPFSSLAKENYYTVIEGYLDSCSICKRLEAEFPDFLKQRGDVVIRRVHFPEGGINLSFTGEDQAAIKKQAEEFSTRIKSYDFCGTPHIEIYDANQQLIVADTCKTKPATDFLRKWMSAES